MRTRRWLSGERYARALMDWFRRRLRKAAAFRTVSGVVNRIERRQRGVLQVVGGRPAHNALVPKAGFSLRLVDCQVAIGLLVQKGRVDRKDLEQAGRHSSALMGLILTFLADHVLLVTLYTRRHMLRLRRPRVHIGGLEREGEDAYDAVADAGGTYLLMSWFYLRRMRRGRSGGPPAWRRHVERHGFELLVDCGIFSFHQERLRAVRRGATEPPIDLDALFDAYCQWLVDYKLDPYTYMAFDVMGNPAATRRYLLAMLQRGLRPIPVFHYDRQWRSGEWWIELEWLWRQGFDVIALGNSVGIPEPERIAWVSEVLRRVPANRQNYHGLGFGSLSVGLLPFFSVDATTHRVGRTGGRVLTDFGQLPTALDGDEAVRLNVAWQVGVGARCQAGGLQLRLDELLDGRVRLNA